MGGVREEVVGKGGGVEGRGHKVNVGCGATWARLTFPRWAAAQEEVGGFGGKLTHGQTLGTDRQRGKEGR